MRRNRAFCRGARSRWSGSARGFLLRSAALISALATAAICRLCMHLSSKLVTRGRERNVVDASRRNGTEEAKVPVIIINRQGVFGLRPPGLPRSLRAKLATFVTDGRIPEKYGIAP